MADTKLVDAEIRTLVLEAARARLTLVREQELQEFGAASTTLALVARNALLKWKPPKSLRAAVPPRKATTDEIRAWAKEQGRNDHTGRVSKELRRAYTEAHGLQVTALRFSMPTDSYDTIRDALHAHGLSVAGVIQQALERFARTAKY